MIDYLRGTLTDIRTESVILEVNGVGYELAVQTGMASLPPAGEQMRFLHTCRFG